MAPVRDVIAAAARAMVRLVLRAYPRRFRERFGADVQASLDRDLAEASADGTPALLTTSVREVRQSIGGVLPQHRLERARPGRLGALEAVALFARSVMDDARLAVRALRKTPSFTLVALVVLAVGIGASTAIVSVVDAVMLRGLPFDEPGRLVALGEIGLRIPGRPPDTAIRNVRVPNYLEWQARQASFSAMAATTAIRSLVLVNPNGELEQARAMRVTAGFFGVLRARAPIGRVFTVSEETAGNDNVAVISDGFWRRRFGGDPGVVGRTLTTLDRTHRIVGVMGHRFSYYGRVDSASPYETIEVLVPYVVPESERVRSMRRFSSPLRVIARLRDSVAIDAAQAEMTQVAIDLDRATPEWSRGAGVSVVPLLEFTVGAPTRSWMLLLLGAVGFVLLIACANVANLMLARATARERELGVRAALGAGRRRLVRYLLVESLVLSSAAAAAGVALAWLGIDLLRAAMPEGIPRVADMAMDLRVLGAAVAMALGTGLLFGTLPAWQASQPNLTRALNEAGRGTSAGAARQSLRSALVVTEVAIAVVMLVGAALFMGSFLALTRLELGFEPRGVSTAAIQLRNSDPELREQNGVRLSELVDRIGALPDVQSAALISGGLPLEGRTTRLDFSIPGRTVEDDGISLRRVTPEYFRTMGVPLRAGRPFATDDREDRPLVAILNEAAAARYFPNHDPIGLMVSSRGDRRIVGIVGNVRQDTLETAMLPEIYIPVLQSSRDNYGGHIVVRTAAEPAALASSLRTAASAVFPDVPLGQPQTMEALISGLVAQRRFNMLVLGIFGALALVIAAAGIYGVMTFVVAQRTREIGVRMALGAQPGTVLRMVMSRAAGLAAAGLAVGVVASWWLGATIEAFLFRLEPHDWRVFTVACVVLMLAALLAAAIPARRAAKIDPLTALRR